MMEETESAEETQFCRDIHGIVFTYSLAVGWLLAGAGVFLMGAAAFTGRFYP